MGLLSGKTALITGASRGIGKSIALLFAREGANIAITNIVDDEEFKRTVNEIEALGVKAKGYVSNAASFADSQKVADEVVKDFTRIDILVNNAGITKRYFVDENDRGPVGCCYSCQPEISFQSHKSMSADHA
jgi:3-oxoacyl-[acyl-carrier protein] reductase